MIRPYCCAALAALTVGCVGTEVGNPQETADVTVEFSVVPEDQRALTLDNGIELDSVWLALEEVGLRETARCDESERFDDESPFAVELLTGRELPDAPMLSLQTTNFCKMELELEPFESDEFGEIPPEIATSSVFISGRLEDDTPFEVELEIDDTIELDGPFEARGVTRLIVAFDLNTWLTADSFADVQTDPDGVLRLSELSSPDAAEQISDAIIRSGRLVRDINNNGTFDQDDELLATSATES